MDMAIAFKRVAQRLGWITALVLTAVWVVACQPSSNAPPPGGDQVSSVPVVLNGGGATFPLFLYQRWFSDYAQINPDVQVNYQPVGSAAGIQQLISGTLDFGASDVAMTDEEIAQVSAGVVLVPMTAGAVAIAYNLPEVEGPLQLSRQVYSDIFLGRITQWNDPKLVALNPDMPLPDLPISVIHRSDGSGTTAVFTNHLSAINGDWQAQVGTGLSVQWPTGVGIKSNAGVSAQIQQAIGTIGYVENSYAEQLGLTTAALENRAGNYLQPDSMSITAALEEVEMPPDLRVFIPDPSAEEAYPIVTYSWMLAYQTYGDAAKAEALKAVLTWSLTDGQAVSESLGYVPLPQPVVAQALAAVDTIAS